MTDWWLTEWLIGLLTDRLTDWMIDWPTDWPIGRLTDWLIDWPNDWHTRWTYEMRQAASLTLVSHWLYWFDGATGVIPFCLIYSMTSLSIMINLLVDWPDWRTRWLTCWRPDWKLSNEQWSSGSTDWPMTTRLIRSYILNCSCLPSAVGHVGPLVPCNIIKLVVVKDK